MKPFIMAICIYLMGSLSYGSTYFLLTDLGSSAEMISRGNIEGFSESSNAIFENPAGLYKTKNYSLSMFTTTIIDEVLYNNISASFKWGKGVFGFGYMESGVTGISETGSTENDYYYETGKKFNYKSSIIKIAYQYSLTKKLHLGITGSRYMTDIGHINGTGYGIDAGLHYTFKTTEFSFNMRNVYSSPVNYSGQIIDPETGTLTPYTAIEDLPVQYVFGMIYPIGSLHLYTQFKLQESTPLYAMGLSFNFPFIKALRLSIGYKEYAVFNEARPYITFGASLKLLELQLDYAYEASDYIEIDSNQYFSISINF